MKKNVLSQQLKKIREQKGLSYKDMGGKIGVDYRAIKRYELNESKPSADILEKYVNEFGVTFEYLFYGEEISDMELYNKFKKLSPKQKKSIKTVMDAF